MTELPLCVFSEEETTEATRDRHERFEDHMIEAQDDPIIRGEALEEGEAQQGAPRKDGSGSLNRR